MFAASEGIVTGTIELEGRPLDIRILTTNNDSGPESLKNLPISVPSTGNNNSGSVYLGSVADIEWIESETALVRQDRSDVMYVDLFPGSGKKANLQKVIASIVMEGIKNNAPWSGSFMRADEPVFLRYRSALIATVVLVLILLYLVLGAQFESFLLPLILMLAVPFSLAGAGPALFLSGSSLDSGAVLGLVALFGIAVNNGIVLYENSEEKIRRGLSPAAAVYSGSLERFRPVLLTTLTTVFALLRLILSPIGNSQRSMASTMLGGIIISGFLAFFALPPVFIRFIEKRRRRL